jgi:3-methyladenine DNA glycosylase AlkC
MPEPLKNLYNPKLINALCELLTQKIPDFETEKFTQYVFDKNWKNRELKARMAHISHALKHFIKLDYAQTLDVLTSISPNFNGFEYMFFSGFVELFGLNDYANSTAALARFTPNASAEFGVRPFIKKYEKAMMKQMNLWAKSDDHHLRRLASEGCRPRLPWAMSLPKFKQNPTLILPILDILKNDTSDYVRRSVANNLNDIAKDNPAIVIDIAKKWLGKTKETDQLVKHGCRTLLKQGTAEVLELFGFNPPKHIQMADFFASDGVMIGETLDFNFVLNSAQPLGKLRLEYALDFVRKNGQFSRKIFKISESESQNHQKIVHKRHSFKPISTRVYYEGTHKITLICNGCELGNKNFQLTF